MKNKRLMLLLLMASLLCSCVPRKNGQHCGCSGPEAGEVYLRKNANPFLYGPYTVLSVKDEYILYKNSKNDTFSGNMKDFRDEFRQAEEGELKTPTVHGSQRDTIPFEAKHQDRYKVGDTVGKKN